MYRAILNAISAHGFTYARSKYVTFSPQHLSITPAICSSESQGSCQVIVQACFTAKPTANTFRHPPPTTPPPPAVPNVFFMIIPWLHGDDQNFIPMPKASGSVSCFIQGLLMQSVIPLQFRPLICMEQFEQMHIVNTDVLFRPGDVVG